MFRYGFKFSDIKYVRELHWRYVGKKTPTEWKFTPCFIYNEHFCCLSKYDLIYTIEMIIAYGDIKEFENVEIIAFKNNKKVKTRHTMSKLIKEAEANIIIDRLKKNE